MVDLSDVPGAPGIYIFKDTREMPIYIGKAVNLRNRVRSYWNQTAWRSRPKLAVLVPQVAEVETIITANEREALILEANLIYKYQPKYNVLLKDDKTFPWIAITYGEDFPRLIPVRDLGWLKRKYPKAKLFGPYTDTGEMYKTLGVGKMLFPLRKRAKPLFRDRPCLNYHLGQCLGPCQGLVQREEYTNMLKGVELFLQGRHEVLLEELKSHMEEASQEQQYERAAKLRDQIRVLHKASEGQRIVTDDIDCNRDIIGIATSEDALAVQLFKMRDGKLVGREGYTAQLNEVQTLEETILSVIEQAYILRQSSDMPGELLMQRIVESKDLSQAFIEEVSFEAKLKNIFENLAEKKVAVQFPQRGEKKEQIELAAYNALQGLQSKQRQRAKGLIALELLKDALQMARTPQSIDCFDISHLAGTQVVASCVRFYDAEPQKTMYRRIKLSIDQNDDFYSMREAVTRRYDYKPEELPDIVLIDGGKGQLSSAHEALAKLELEQGTTLISLAKKEEEVYAVGGHRVLLPKDSPALRLLMRLRDEAHRFAITFNRERRAKSMKRSFVDDLPGVGVVLREKIMKNFTHAELIAAAPQLLNQRLGIGAKRADRLWQAIQNKRLDSPNHYAE